MLDKLATIGRFGLFAGGIARRLRVDRCSTVRSWLNCGRQGCPGCESHFRSAWWWLFRAWRSFGSSAPSDALIPDQHRDPARTLAVLASVLVAAQGGSSCAASLGAMRIKEELDATEVMAIDSLKYYVVPRVIAMTIACPLLNIAGSIAGVGGGYFTAVYLKGESGGIFLAELWAFMGPMDVYEGIIKTTLFGTIGLISCYHGFRATGGAAGVSRRSMTPSSMRSWPSSRSTTS